MKPFPVTREQRVDRILAAILPIPLEELPVATLAESRKAIGKMMDEVAAENERFLLYGAPDAPEPRGILHMADQ